MARLTRLEQAQENRTRILRSAREHFERHGYHGASVDAIADDAGFSKGAIYSQFGSKDELMLAVLEHSIDERQRGTDRLIESRGAGVGFAAVMRDAMSTSLRSAAWQASLAEFRIHAWRHPELNERYRRLHERTVDKVAASIGAVLEAQETAATCDSREIAIGVLAANTGLVLESFAGASIDMADLVVTLGSLLRTEPATATARGGRT